MAFLRPDSTTSAGSWTTSAGGVDLHSAIDEISADDADYIQSSASPSNDTCVIALSNPAGGVDETAAVAVNYRYQRVGTQNVDLTVSLKEGATTIATQSHANIPATVTAGTLTLSTGEKSAVTDWDALTLEFVANASTGAFSAAFSSAFS